MNKLIIPTGYMGSGSSAITDLLREYEGYKAVNGSFEYVFLHCPNGVFDLEDKLLVGNNAIRSDEALHSFYKMMKDLYDKKLWWPADYRHKLSSDFIRCVDKYVESLVDYKSDYYWYMQERYGISGTIKMAIRMIVRKITFNKVTLKKPLLYSPMLISLKSNDEFYDRTKVFILDVLKLMGIEESSIIVDQLLLPFNLWRMDNYFNDNAKCFVVERDPRDVYILNKYYWGVQSGAVPYPSNVEEFCKYYKRLRNVERIKLNKNIYRLNFEDLIYRYDETVPEIEKFLGLDDDKHINKKRYFDPNISINNTQLFLRDEYRDEGEYIAENLSEYTYVFPYKHCTEGKKVF